MSNNQQPIGAEEYYQLLLRLMKEGKGYGPQGQVAVVPLDDGLHALVTKDLELGREIKKRGVQASDMILPGVARKKLRTLSHDYMLSDPSTGGDGLVWKHDPNSYRIGITVSEDMTIPVQWAKEGFKIAAGGMVYMFQKHIREISDALQAIKDGKSKVEDALFTKDGSGNKVAKFDVYGSDAPDPRELGFEPVRLNNQARWLSAQFGGPVPKKPEFIVYPERATFRKKSIAPVASV